MKEMALLEIFDILVLLTHMGILLEESENDIRQLESDHERNCMHTKELYFNQCMVIGRQEEINHIRFWKEQLYVIIKIIYSQ